MVNSAYHKAGKSSQIDFIFTNQHGRKYITDFEIIDKFWHLSDRLPLALNLRLTFQISSDMLLARAMELNNYFQPITKISSCRFKFNSQKAQEMLQHRYPIILEVFAGNSNDEMIKTLDENLISVLNTNKEKCKSFVNIGNENESTDCDNLFNDYVNKMQNPLVDERDTNNAYEKYPTERNKLTTNIFKSHEEKYKSIIQQGDERKLWAEINWSGRYKESSNQQIPIQIMYNYFEQLYQPLDINETNTMEKLHTDMYIPITDDPITTKELHYASSKMKKGGCEFSLEVLKITDVLSFTTASNII